LLELHEEQTYILGRHPHCDLVVEDPHVSRNHAGLETVNNIWVISNIKATNGTLVNSVRISGRVALSQGDRIQIGGTHLRFHEQIPENPHTAPSPVRTDSLATPRPTLLSLSNLLPATTGSTIPSPGNTAIHEISTLLPVDDLSVLLTFANTSLRDENPQALIRRALEVLARQTEADMVAYVPLDPDASEQRVLWSRNNRVDIKISRRLNQATVESARPIWLEEQRKQGLIDSDSVRTIRDALCIPLYSRLPDRECLGTFHLYRLEREFQLTQTRFAEAIGLSFSSAMRSLRDRLALQAENTRLRELPSNAGRLIGSSIVMTSLRERISHLARAQVPVLILGEPGVGKGLVAEMIHQQSNRRHYSLVRVDCQGMTPLSSERQIFGDPNEGGTTTQASYLSQAEMGVLLLDEVARLSLPLQRQLLKILESRQTSPNERPERADVRILATSSQDLLWEVREGRFLEELYHRFVWLLQVPPLREHASDIPELVEFFLDLLRREYHTEVTLEPAAMERLQRCSWPGNVRQLRSILEVAVANKGPSGVIRAEDLAFSDERRLKLEAPPSLNLAKLEEWAIKQVLAQTEGNKTQAAKILGIHRETLGLKMKQYQLPES
jgi:DNA-binding NtrC family response regulator